MQKFVHYEWISTGLLYFKMYFVLCSFLECISTGALFRVYFNWCTFYSIFQLVQECNNKKNGCHWRMLSDQDPRGWYYWPKNIEKYKFGKLSIQIKHSKLCQLKMIHWFRQRHFSYFSSLCVFKCVLNWFESLANEDDLDGGT